MDETRPLEDDGGMGLQVIKTGPGVAGEAVVQVTDALLHRCDATILSALAVGVDRAARAGDCEGASELAWAYSEVRGAVDRIYSRSAFDEEEDEEDDEEDEGDEDE